MVASYAAPLVGLLLLLCSPSTQAGPNFTGRRLLGVSAAPSALIPIVAAAVGMVLTLLLVVSLFVWRRHTKGGNVSPNSSALVKHGLWNGPSQGKADPEAAIQEAASDKLAIVPVSALTLNDIQVATDNFKAEGVLSESGHGSVHRAEGPNGEQWAVKRTKPAAIQGEHLFRSEIDFLSQISHPNILTLVASCEEHTEQILVFEYMPNGSLADWLRPPAGVVREPLSLWQRLDIAVGVAEALRYLHAFSKPTIIHRDVRSDSILLDDALHARLAGLGLLKHLPGEGMRLRMATKKGYLDPEYFQSFKVTTKCDVYSFGVVLLELLTGHAPILALPQNGSSAKKKSHKPTTLAQYGIQAVEEGRAKNIVDPRMPNEGDSFKDSIDTLAKIASRCVAPLRKNRPDMAKVVHLLHKLRNPAAADVPEKASSQKVVPVDSAQ